MKYFLFMHCRAMNFRDFTSNKKDHNLFSAIKNTKGVLSHLWCAKHLESDGILTHSTLDEKYRPIQMRNETKSVSIARSYFVTQWKTLKTHSFFFSMKDSLFPTICPLFLLALCEWHRAQKLCKPLKWRMHRKISQLANNQISITFLDRYRRRS